jgi:hypothetical protein
MLTQVAMFVAVLATQDLPSPELQAQYKKEAREALKEAKQLLKEENDHHRSNVSAPTSRSVEEQYQGRAGRGRQEKEEAVAGSAGRLLGE